MYAGLDLIADKLERQIRKYKTKVNRKIRDREGVDVYFRNNIAPKENEGKNEEIEIVRTKQL